MSVINANNYYNIELEIIVNNDSNDITEIYKDKVIYQYKQSNNLSDLYRDLYIQSTKEYVYFLEDDDMISTDFFKTLDQYNEDIFYFNYKPYEWHKHFIKHFRYSDNDYDLDRFLYDYDDLDFQFSQICFKKECLCIDDFPKDNNLYNDFNIFRRLKGSFRSINKFLYTQTIDGGDNISFSSLNKDDRWIS